MNEVYEKKMGKEERLKKWGGKGAAKKLLVSTKNESLGINWSVLSLHW